MEISHQSGKTIVHEACLRGSFKDWVVRITSLGLLGYENYYVSELGYRGYDTLAAAWAANDGHTDVLTHESGFYWWIFGLGSGEIPTGAQQI